MLHPINTIEAFALRRCRLSQRLLQVLRPAQSSLCEYLPSSRKIIAAIQQQRPHNDLLRHRILMMINMARTSWAKVAMYMLPARTLVRVLIRSSFQYCQCLPRDDVVATIRPTAQLLARIAVAYNVLQFLVFGDADFPFYIPAVTRALPHTAQPHGFLRFRAK